MRACLAIVGAAALGVLGGCGDSAPSSTVGGMAGGGMGNGGTSGLMLGGAAGSAPKGGSGGAVHVEPGNGPHEWFVFEAPDGIYAYDAGTHPATDIIKLGEPPGGDYASGFGPKWARDGTRVIDFSGDSLLLWDMTGTKPSAPITLATGLKPEAEGLATAWSGDGKTVVLIQNKVLYAMDPSGPMPTQHAITDSIVLYGFAPKGNGLIYDDTTGMNFVRVEAGVPTSPQYADELGANWTWSPDGEHFGSMGLSLKLFDVSVEPMQATDVFPLMLTYAASPQFSFDGTYFSFNSGNGIEALMYGAVATSAQVSPLAGPMADSRGGGHSWVPEHSSVIFNATYPPDYMPSGDWFIADVSGADPVTPKAIPGTATPWRWIPGGLKFITMNETHTELGVIDLGADAPEPLPFPAPGDTILDAQVSQDGSAVAFWTGTTLHLAAVDDPTAPSIDRVVSPNTEDSVYAMWSPSGRYMSLSVWSNDYSNLTLQIGPIERTTLAEPATVLKSAMGKLLGSSWQPSAPAK